MTEQKHTPDCRADNSGLDDGPPLPRHILHERLKEDARTLVEQGATLREAADVCGVSHETIRVWTVDISKRRHVRSATGESSE